MEYKMTVSSLTHDDLVNLFSSALYGNGDMLSADYDTHFKHYTTPGTCFEDKLADILLKGGEINFYDIAGADDDPEVYTKGYTIKTDIEEHKRHDWFFGEQVFHYGIYTINLQNILDAINANKKAQDYAKTLFVDEDGDMWTAYNLMQIILFGKEIYA